MRRHNSTYLRQRGVWDRLRRRSYPSAGEKDDDAQTSRGHTTIPLVSPENVTLRRFVDALEDLGAGLDNPAVNDSRSMVHHPNHGR